MASSYGGGGAVLGSQQPLGIGKLRTLSRPVGAVVDSEAVVHAGVGLLDPGCLLSLGNVTL